MRSQISLLFVLLLVLTTSCDATIASETSAPRADFVTATLPPTSAPLPTQTPLPPTIAPTVQPIEGTTTTQINVRAGTSTVSENLGMIPQFSKVQVIGRDSTSSWYQVIFAGPPTGTGWVRAEYVQVNATAEIPVIGTGAGGGSGVSGLVIQKINIRSGPGTSFESLGELNPNDVVFILGRDSGGEWAQIEFAGSADRTGWAALKYLQVENADALPIIGVPSPTLEAAAGEIATPTNALLPAMQDGDSMQSPLASLSFSALGARTAQIQGDVSSPNGDVEDWVKFTSFNKEIAIQLLCAGDGLQMELWRDGQVVDSFSLACGGTQLLELPVETTHWLRISQINLGEFRYTKYTLVLEVSQ